MGHPLLLQKLAAAASGHEIIAGKRTQRRVQGLVESLRGVAAAQLRVIVPAAFMVRQLVLPDSGFAGAVWIASDPVDDFLFADQVWVVVDNRATDHVARPVRAAQRRAFARGGWVWRVAAGLPDARARGDEPGPVTDIDLRRVPRHGPPLLAHARPAPFHFARQIRDDLGGAGVNIGSGGRSPAAVQAR